jgi:hypothetical protein
MTSNELGVTGSYLCMNGYQMAGLIRRQTRLSIAQAMQDDTCPVLCHRYELTGLEWQKAQMTLILRAHLQR